MKLIFKILLLFFPWCIRRVLLNKFYHYNLSPTAYIGFSFIYPKYLEMDDGAHIGPLNIAIHLDSIKMGKNSSISQQNWITGFPVNSKSKFFSHDKTRKSELILGRESAITKKHHIDCTNSIHIGNYVTIAGYNSQLLSHSIDLYECRQDSHPIKIGDYCFVGTGTIILGGSVLPAYSVLGAGALLNKKFNDEWTLYAGVPAKPVKNIPHTAKYFSRKHGFIY